MRKMSIDEYYNYPHSIKECAKKFGMKEKSVKRKLNKMKISVDGEVPEHLKNMYIGEIMLVKFLLGYDVDPKYMQTLKEKNYELWFRISWRKAVRRLT